MLRVGTGQDIHGLSPDGQLVLAGVSLAGPGFNTHSDGDVVAHAIVDSLAGALAAGTLGDFFPENDPSDQDAASIDFLRRFLPVLERRGARVVNIDVTVEIRSPSLRRTLPRCVRTSPRGSVSRWVRSDQAQIERWLRRHWDWKGRASHRGLPC